MQSRVVFFSSSLYKPGLDAHQKNTFVWFLIFNFFWGLCSLAFLHMCFESHHLQCFRILFEAVFLLFISGHFHRLNQAGSLLLP